MTPEGLSQEEINAMLNMVGDSEDDGPDLSDFSRIVVSNLSSSMGTSINNPLEMQVAGEGMVSGDALGAEPQVILSRVPFEEGATGTMFLVAPISMASIFVDLMMMGEGTAKDSMEEDDLDAYSDLLNTSFSSCVVPLNEAAQGVKFRFASVSSSVFDQDSLASALGDESLYRLEISVNAPGKVDGTLQLLIPQTLAQEISSAFSEQESASDGDDLFDFSDVDLENLAADDSSADFGGFDSGGGGGGAGSSSLNKEQMRNIEMLLDIDLAVIIRIGSTKIYLKDLLKLGSGSIVELDKKAGDPVELVVNKKVIARGEVVVIDANFGLRINEILSKRDRLESLRG